MVSGLWSFEDYKLTFKVKFDLGGQTSFFENEKKKRVQIENQEV